MQLNGNWSGKYMYRRASAQAMIGHPFTRFEINITREEHGQFWGSVQDDLTTGGMEGVGEIEGTIQNNFIAFDKRMPKATMLVGLDGSRAVKNKPHPTVYYEGTIDEGGNAISGTWRFKFGIFWLGIFPMFILPIKGTWSMERMGQNHEIIFEKG